MNSKKKGNWLAGAISLLISLACALVLGAVFYGAMAYQLAGGGEAAPQEAQQTQGARLALAGAQLTSEQAQESVYGGQTCTALVREYALEGGGQARAVTASPAAYIERLAQEGYVPQLITGFTLAGMEAVYYLRGEEALLAARAQEEIYILEAQADEAAVYALGASAFLE